VSPLGVAEVGLGWWGRVVAPLLKTSTKFKVVLGVDPRAEAAEFTAKQGIGYEPKFEKALKHPDVQAVVLCTPHSLHNEQIVRAAGAKKHVFCEKPLAMSRAEVLKAVKACNDNKVALAVGHEKRFEPPIQEIMRAARAGELGSLLQIEANFSQNKFLLLPDDNWRLSEKEAPAGPMTATGIHLLDLAIGLLGPAEEVFASVRQLGSQLANGDTLAVLVSHKSGSHSLISAMLATPFDGRFAIYGSLGWMEVRDRAHPEAPKGWTLTRSSRTSEKAPRNMSRRPRCSPISRPSPTPPWAASPTRCRRTR